MRRVLLVLSLAFASCAQPEAQSPPALAPLAPPSTDARPTGVAPAATTADAPATPPEPAPSATPQVASATPAASATPEVTSRQVAALLERAVVAMEQLANAIVAAGSNCGRIAQLISSFADRNAALLEQTAEARRSLSRDEQAALRTKYTPRVEALAKRVGRSAAACNDDPRVEEAASKMPRVRFD